MKLLYYKVWNSDIFFMALENVMGKTIQFNADFTYLFTESDSNGVIGINSNIFGPRKSCSVLAN